jgi:uncharacterized membrane protein
MNQTAVRQTTKGRKQQFFCWFVGCLAPNRSDENNAMVLFSFATHEFVSAAVRSGVDRNRIMALLCLCSFATAACSAVDAAEPSPSVEQNGGAPAEVSAPLATTWCAARAVLEAKCQRCHGAEPEHGAPFALVSYDDTQVLNAKGNPRYAQISAAVSSDFMPPSFLKLEPEVEPLSEEERATLLDWCEQGAPGPALDESCDGP